MQGSADDAGAQRGSGDDGPGSLPLAHDWLHYHARHRPAACAVVSGQSQLSYAQLAARSTALARELQALGTGPESRVGLLVERSVDMVVGLLGILEAGAAYVPLDSALPKARLDFMVEDAGITTFVTQPALAPRLRGYGGTLVALAGDAPGTSASSTRSPLPGPSAGNLAYVIYTSGSTGVPKGVMVEHGGLRNLADATRSLLDVGPDSRVLQFASLAFDASVFEIFMALAAGATLYVASEDERAAGPELLQLLRARAITHATFLPSTLASLPADELPALRVLVSAGEPLSSALTARWARGRRLLNAYGPTEATVWASVHACGPDETAPPIGHALPGVDLSVRDEALRPLADGEVGELCIAGAGLARGYLNRPELSAQKFASDPGDPSRRLYRTGDLARRLANGEFVFEGRVDEQIKLRGFRIELGEVESALARLPGLREAIVVVREDTQGERRLCAYVVREDHEPSLEALRSALAAQLPSYMIPSTFVALPELPRGPSGKVDRRALPAPGRERPELEQAYAPPTSPQELVLASMWSEVLGLTPIGRHDDFFALGGDSLHAAQIVARARAALGVDLSVRVLFDARTVASLAGRLAGAPAVAALADDEVTHEGLRPLSLTQQGIWFLHQLAPNSAAYHLPALLHVRGPLDLTALAQAWRALAERHEPLRSVFPAPRGVVQVARGPVAQLALADDLSTLEPEQRQQRLAALRAQELHQPFDLERGPLVRAHLVRLGPEEHVLMLTMHHIVADGWSMRVWLRELTALYRRAPELPRLSLGYGDFARQQRQQLATDGFARARAFWREELAGVPERLDLRADHPRGGPPRFRGELAPFELGPAVHDQLKQLCRVEGASLFMGLLAGFALALRAQGAGPDMLIGTPMAGRGTAELEALIGHFANTIPIRAQLREDLDFIGLLRAVRERALAAYAHQELPFDQLVAELCPRRDENFRPLVQVVLSQQSPPHSIVSVDQTRFDLELLPGEGAPFELSLTLWERPEGGLGGELVFDADLFELDTARAFLERYRQLLTRCAAQPGALLAELTVSPGARLEEPSSLDTLAAAVLRADPMIDDCVVRRRSSERGEELVAYVAGSRGARLSGELAGLVLVPIAAMPLSADGQVDEAALSRLPVVDDELAQRWQARVSALPGVTSVSATVRERVPKQRRIHVDDLLPSAPPTPGPRQLSLLHPPSHTAVVQESRRLAIADGGPLHVAEGAAQTLGEALQRSAETAREKGIRYVRADRSEHLQRYRELYQDALSLLAGLQREGVLAGDRVLLSVDSFEQQLVAFWSCVLGGIAPAIVAPSHDTTFAKLQGAFNTLGRPFVLCMSERAATLRSLAFRPQVLILEDLRADARSARVHAARPEDVAFIQLSSGSTGQAKCIPETHAAVVRHIHSAVAVNGYCADDVTFNWIPFDHVAPILMCHVKDVFIGCLQIHAQTEHLVSDPLLWPEIVQRHAVSHTWCPNFGFKLLASALASAVERSWDLSSIVRFLSGGEQVTLPVLEEFARVTRPLGFDREAIQPAYGMAELATAVTYGRSPHDAQGVHHVASTSLAGTLQFVAPDESAQASVTFVEVGRPAPGVRIRIVDAEQQLLDECTIGRVQVQSQVVMPGYLEDDGENRRAFTDDGWFNTGDLGFLRGGALTIAGREKDTIVVRGANIYCHEVEDLVDTVEGVVPTFSAACGVADRDTATEALAIFFVPEQPGLAAASHVAEAVRRCVSRRLGIAPALVVPLEKAQLPKTSSGKVQRAQLKRALMAGSYRALLKQLDLYAGNERTISDAFHRHVWQRKEVLLEGPLEDGVCLLVSGDPALVASIAAQLGARGTRVVQVAWGAGFQHSAPDRYTLRPAEARDYARMIAELGAPIACVVQLAGCGPERAGGEALLALAQALPARGATQLRLLIAAQRAQTVRADEVADFEKTALVSLVRTLAEEFPQLDARHLDLPLDSPLANARRVVRELGVLQRDREIAYRDEQRLTARLVPVDIVGEPCQSLPFVAGGCYVVSGGLGGIGRVIARYLLEQQRARLLLLGRRALDSDPERLSVYHELCALAERSGAELSYACVDVADERALALAIDGAEARWGRHLDGAIHLAGIIEERLLVDERAEGLRAVSAAKVGGALALASLLRQRPQAAFIAISSANAFLGGLSVGAYAAANRALSAIVHEQRRLGRRHSYCIAWSAWDEQGMSREHAMKRAARAKGYHALSATEGLQTFLAALAREPGEWIVGLQRDHFQIERFGRAPVPAHELCLSLAHGEQASLPHALSLRDRFGAPSEATLLGPERVAGELQEAKSAPLYIAPRDHTERALAEIWRDVLKRERIGLDENFFDLGGQSLLLMQVRGRLQSVFGRELSVADLFRSPTIRSLSAALRDEAQTAPALIGVEERGRRQRQRLAQQRPRTPLAPPAGDEPPLES